MKMQEYRESLEIIPPEMHKNRSKQMGEQEQTEVRKGNLVSVCFMDISAGFDTLPHILTDWKNLGASDTCEPRYKGNIM